MSLFFSFAKNNIYSKEFTNGTIWRQNQQLKRSSYKIDETLKKTILSSGMGIIQCEENPQPSIQSVLERVNELNSENRKLKKITEQIPLYSLARKSGLFGLVKKYFLNR